MGIKSQSNLKNTGSDIIVFQAESQPITMVEIIFIEKRLISTQKAKISKGKKSSPKTQEIEVGIDNTFSL